MPEHYTALIEDLMIDVQRADSIESSFSKIGLAGLIEAREAQVFKEFEGRGRPNPNLLNAADDVWLRSILSHQDKAIRLRMAMCLGLGAEGTPLEAAMQRLEASPDPDVMVDEMRYGYNEGMRRRLSLKPEPGPKGEEDDSERRKVGGHLPSATKRRRARLLVPRRRLRNRHDQAQPARATAPATTVAPLAPPLGLQK